MSQTSQTSQFSLTNFSIWKSSLSSNQPGSVVLLHHLHQPPISWSKFLRYLVFFLGGDFPYKFVTFELTSSSSPQLIYQNPANLLEVGSFWSTLIDLHHHFPYNPSSVFTPKIIQQVSSQPTRGHRLITQNRSKGGGARHLHCLHGGEVHLRGNAAAMTVMSPGFKPPVSGRNMQFEEMEQRKENRNLL